MKQQLLDNLYYVIGSSTSIKLHIDKIDEILTSLELEPDFTDIERIELNNAIKSKVQDEAEQAILNSKGKGHPAILMATGTGKSKIVINRTKLDGLRRLLVVPTVQLRDVTWKAEFYKWGKQDEWKNIKVVRYDDLSNLIGEDEYDEVYLDEGHNLNLRSAEFFKYVKVRKIILLTATKPEDPVRIALLRSLNIYPAYSISLDEAVKLGLVAPYDITIVTTTLDNTDKYLKAGNRAKTWLQTEVAAYNYISSRIIDEDRARENDRIVRMHLLYSCKTKFNAAKWILDNVIPKDCRKLVFAGSIEHATNLLPYRFHSKPSVKKTDTPERKEQVARILETYRGDKDLIRFKQEEINELACVRSISEGENIANLDVGFLPQLDSKQYKFIQKLGRLIRFRPGHIGRVIIIALKDTIDETWVSKATASLNTARIRTVALEDLKSGKETISFT